MESNCKGCINNREGSTFVKSSCVLQVHAIALCPCGTCLVKPMCTDACNKYIYFKVNLDSPGRIKNYKEYFSYDET
jgi:hypothetical protein